MHAMFTVTEAFQHGAHIAVPAEDIDEQYVTLRDHRVWKLTNSEWHEMLMSVRAVSMFLTSVCGSAPRPPLPTPEALSTFLPHGAGVEFWFAAEGRNAEPMSPETLAFCVREAREYGFADGDSIADAGSHSNAELWSDVILPAIERGEIYVTVWGEPL
jgi:hypothetical protein